MIIKKVLPPDKLAQMPNRGIAIANIDKFIWVELTKRLKVSSILTYEKGSVISVTAQRRDELIKKKHKIWTLKKQ